MKKAVVITYITERTVEVVNTIEIDYKDFPTKFEEGEYTMDELVQWIEDSRFIADSDVDENSVDETVHKVSWEFVDVTD